MRESTLEKRLVAAVKAHGGACYKFVSPGHRGVPDRIVILRDPLPRVWFIELKTIRGRLSALQRLETARLAALHQHVAVLRGEKELNDWIAAHLPESSTREKPRVKLRDYQLKAVEHAVDHPRCALRTPCGAGKTIVVLHA